MLTFNPPGASKRSVALAYGVVVVSVIAATVSAWFMQTYWQTDAALALFAVAVVISAWFGGTKPGVLAIAVSALALHCFYLSRTASLAIEPAQIPRLVLFVLTGSLLVWVM